MARPVAGPRLAGLEIEDDEGWPRRVGRGVSGNGVRHLGATVLGQQLSEQQGVLRAPLGAEHAQAAAEQRRLRSHRRQSGLRALQGHVVDVGVRQPTGVAQVVATQRREAVRGEQRAVEVVLTRGTTPIPLQAHDGALWGGWRPVDGLAIRGDGLADGKGQTAAFTSKCNVCNPPKAGIRGATSTGTQAWIL